MKNLIVGVLTLLALAGCSGSSIQGAGSSVPPTSVAPITTAPAPSTSAADPNAAVCDELLTYINDKIKPTFHEWKPDTNEFDQVVAAEFRTEATHMFSLENKATGAPARAIHDEAKGLTDISVAMENEDDAAVGAAANEANSALASLSGACNF